MRTPSTSRRYSPRSNASGLPSAERCQATRANRRGLLTLALIALILGAIIQLATSTPERERSASGETRADVVFTNAEERHLPELARGRTRQTVVRVVHGRPRLRGREAGRHEQLRRAVSAGGAPLSRCQVRPEQQVHHRRHLAGGRRRDALGWRKPAVRTAAARPGRPTDSVQGEDRRPRPVQGVAGRYLSRHRRGVPPVDRRARRVFLAARLGGGRRREPGLAVPWRIPRRARAAGVPGRRVRPGGGRLPRPTEAARRRPGGQLRDDLTGELGGRKPPGVVRRRYPTRGRVGADGRQRQAAAHRPPRREDPGARTPDRGTSDLRGRPHDRRPAAGNRRHRDSAAARAATRTHVGAVVRADFCADFCAHAAPPSEPTSAPPPEPASEAPTTTATSPPALGPPPGPPPSGPPPGPPPPSSESAEPAPGVFEIPGMAPITLPWLAPPPPPPAGT